MDNSLHSVHTSNKLKRRRERDRPKAGPTALYNPNKRVLLCYDEGEQDGDISVIGEEHDENRLSINELNYRIPVKDVMSLHMEAGVEAINMDNYQFDQYPSDEEHELDNAVSQSEDRLAPLTNIASSASMQSLPLQDLPERDRIPRVTKRKPKGKNIKSNTRSKPGRDETTNQTPALGSLSFQLDEDGDMEGDDPEEIVQREAMAYLRAVRSERDRIPDVLHAQIHVGHDAEEAVEDENELYREHLASVPQQEILISSDRDPRAVSDSAIIRRFADLHARLHHVTSLNTDVLAQARLQPYLEKSHAINLKLFSDTDPQHARLHMTDQDTVFAFLSCIRRKLLAHGRVIAPRSAAWIWALFARLDPVGLMDNDQVYELREFAKKLIIVQLSFDNPSAAQQLQQMMEEEQDEEEPRTDLEEHSGPQDANFGDTLITCDIVLTIIGNAFGQRDLLEHRLPWPNSRTAQA